MVIFHTGLWVLHIWDVFLGDLLYILGSNIFNKPIQIGLIVTYCLPLFYIILKHFVFCRKNAHGEPLQSPVMRCINALAIFCRVDQAIADSETLDPTYVKVMTGMIFMVSEDMPQLML